MPNHVINLVSVVGEVEEVQRMREAIRPDVPEEFSKCKALLKNTYESLDKLHFTQGGDRDLCVKIEDIYKPIQVLMKEFWWDSNNKIIDRVIDFYKILPYPPNIYQGSLGMEEEKKYGKENCWYSWNIENWGTKWGAYSQCNHSDTEFSFQTAWSLPLPVYTALSSYFPNLVFNVKYADEDIGSNCGHLVFKDGEAKNISNFEDCSDEAAEFANELWSRDY